MAECVQPSKSLSWAWYGPAGKVSMPRGRPSSCFLYDDSRGSESEDRSCRHAELLSCREVANETLVRPSVTPASAEPVN